MKKIYKIEGMDCTSCALLIEAELEDAGLKGKCSYASQMLEVEVNGKKDEDKAKNAVKQAGYLLKI